MLSGVPPTTAGTGSAMGGAFFLPRANLQDLLDLLREVGRRLIGPTIADEAIVYDEISNVDELPHGWRDEQEPGTYRLVRQHDSLTFGYVVGPTSWKRFTFPPVVPLTGFEATTPLDAGARRGDRLGPRRDGGGC